jgi:hypothetical protein
MRVLMFIVKVLSIALFITRRVRIVNTQTYIKCPLSVRKKISNALILPKTDPTGREVAAPIVLHRIINCDSNSP